MGINFDKFSKKELELLVQFPYENPNPVIRLTADGIVTFANKASENLLLCDDCTIGKKVPGDWQVAVIEAIKTGKACEIEISRTGHFYSLTFTPLESLDFVYVYGLDITEKKKTEEALKKSEKSLVNAQAIAHVGSWEWNNISGEVIWSDEAYRIFGYAPHEISVNFDIFMKSVHPDDRETVRKTLDKAVKEGEPYKFIHRIVRPDGEEVVVLEQGRAFYNSPGEPQGITGTIQYLARQKESEGQLNLADKIFQKALEGVMIVDANVKIISVNPSFTRITGYTKQEVVGENPRILRSDRHTKEFYEQMWNDILSTGSWSGEIWNRRKSGEAYLEFSSISVIKDEFGRVEKYISVFHDLSEVRKSQEELKYRTNYDALTGLPNRTLFIDRLSQLITYAKDNKTEFALVNVGIDNFRKINESMGHAAGDSLLQEVGERIFRKLRSVDTISRFGGDEFAIILEDVRNLGHAANVAQKIIEAFEKPFLLGAEEVYMTASLGVSLYPNDGETAEVLVQNSDTAMSRAKSEGKNRYQFFAPEMNEMAVHKMTLEKDIRIAIAEDQLVVHYQPKVETKSGKITGVEALIRWNHPTVGMMYPNSFIQVAEDTGLIVKIGMNILKESCRRNKLWLDAGLGPVSMAVNLSARQFMGPDIAKIIGNVLSETGLPPEYLELEITESMVMQNVDSVISILTKLKKMGVRISIDDFGTGYSSFAYLKKFPIDTLKIDKVFVDDIVRNEGEAKIIKAMISMAHSLKLDVVAEGVETKEQYELLREAGCDMIQGYYFSRPVSASGIEKLLYTKKDALVE